MADEQDPAWALTLPKLFGRAVRQQREKLGLTAENVADRARLDRDYLHKVEDGTIDVNLSTIWRVALALKVLPCTLVMDTLLSQIQFPKDRDELHALNTDLGTIDAQYQEKISELSKLEDDFSYVSMATVKELESKVVEQDQALADSYRELDDLAYTSAHDLKALVRGAKIQLQELAELTVSRKVISADVREHTDKIAELNVSLTDIVDSLVQFANLGREELEWRNVPLKNIVADLADEFSRSDPGHIEIVTKSDYPVVLGDYARIKQVFKHIMENGIRFNDSPKKVIEVASSTTLNDNRAVITFKDNGVGIPPEHSRTIFKLFKQIHREDEFVRGNGVGLAFAKRIAERHKGRLWVESIPRIGSTFFLSLLQPAKV